MVELQDNLKHVPAPTVKRILREKGLTQTDVARMLGVTPQLVCQVIRRKAKSSRVSEKLRELIGSEAITAALLAGAITAWWSVCLMLAG